MATNNPFMPDNKSKSKSTSASKVAGTPMPGTSAARGVDNFEIDLTEVQSNFVIPDGAYRVKCLDVEQTVSKSNNPMFVWTFEVAEGDHTGFQSKVFTAITPAAMWKVAETVQALGVGETGKVVKFKRSDVVGKDCGALFEQSEYNGQNRSSIVRVMSLAELREAQSN